MIAAILIGLLKVNLAAGVAILFVLALRTPVRSRFGAWAAYPLWLAPLAAAVAILAPHRAAQTLISPVVLTATTAMDAFVAAAPATSGGRSSLILAIFGLWTIGSLAATGLLLRRQAAFLTAMGRLTSFAAGGVFRAEHAGVGPAVVGLLRPRIVAPADFETRFGAQERELILAHERVHLRRGDAAVNALACAAQCLCWFNPLVHAAARLMRFDQELACDATVIGRFPQARRSYAELLLKTQLATQPLPLGCPWPAGSAHPLKARIAMLKSPPPGRAMRGVGLFVVGALSLGAASLAWASSPTAPIRDEVQSRVTMGDPATPTADTSDLRIELRTVTDRKGQRVAEARREMLRTTQLHALDAERGGVPPVIVRPDWLIKPKGADVVDVYPPEALKAGINGAATIGCAVSLEGRLVDCKLLDEAPAQAGFGEAALKLSERFQMKPMSRDGHPVSGGKIRIPIRFALPRAPQPVTPS